MFYNTEKEENNFFLNYNFFRFDVYSKHLAFH